MLPARAVLLEFPRDPLAGRALAALAAGGHSVALATGPGEWAAEALARALLAAERAGAIALLLPPLPGDDWEGALARMTDLFGRVDAVLARRPAALDALTAALDPLPPRRRPRLARLALPGELGCACEGPREGEILFDVAAAGLGAADRAADRAALDAWLAA